MAHASGTGDSVYYQGEGQSVSRSSVPENPQLYNGRLMSRCPRCGVFVQDDYLVCPYCALSLKKECTKCKRQIPLNWNACSYCGQVIVNIVPQDSERLNIELPPKIEVRPIGVMVKGKVMLRGRCPRCGRLIMDDARFCDSCGWKVEDAKLKPLSER